MTTAATTTPKTPDSVTAEYDADFVSWTRHQAELLRTGQFDRLDVDNLIDEVESLGKRDRRELFSRTTVLIAHLLKWHYQTDKRSRSWQSTIIEQREQVDLVLDDSPSLRPVLQTEFGRLYRRAVERAARETELPENTFPVECPYSIEDVLGDVWPGGNSDGGSAPR